MQCARTDERRALAWVSFLRVQTKRLQWMRQASNNRDGSVVLSCSS